MVRVGVVFAVKVVVLAEGSDDGHRERRADAEDPIRLERLFPEEELDRPVEQDGERPAALAHPDADRLVDALRVGLAPAGRFSRSVLFQRPAAKSGVLTMRPTIRSIMVSQNKKF